MILVHAAVERSISTATVKKLNKIKSRSICGILFWSVVAKNVLSCRVLFIFVVALINDVISGRLHIAQNPMLGGLSRTVGMLSSKLLLEFDSSSRSKSSCKPSQNLAELPKYLLSLNAVSAEMHRKKYKLGKGKYG